MTYEAGEMRRDSTPAGETMADPGKFLSCAASAVDAPKSRRPTHHHEPGVRMQVLPYRLQNEADAEPVDGLGVVHHPQAAM